MSSNNWICDTCGMEWDNDQEKCPACGNFRNKDIHTLPEQDDLKLEHDVEVTENKTVIEEPKREINDIGKQLVKLKQSGDSYSAKGNYTDAIKAYEEALKLDPKNAMLMELIGDMHMKKNSYREACIYYSDAYEQDPTMTVLKDKIGIAMKKESSSKEVYAEPISKPAPKTQNKSHDNDRPLTDKELSSFMQFLMASQGIPTLRCEKCGTLIMGKYYRATSRFGTVTIMCEKCGNKAKSDRDSRYVIRCICSIIIIILTFGIGF